MQQKVVTRLFAIAASVLLLVISGVIVSKVFKDTILYFYSPSEITNVKPNQKLRLGGFVKLGSLHKSNNNYEFIITDFEKEVKVYYSGLLPNLFRDGQGTIAIGAFDSAGIFHAETLMAKHDENYMPKEVADKLKAKGLWKENQPQ